MVRRHCGLAVHSTPPSWFAPVLAGGKEICRPRCTGIAGRATLEIAMPKFCHENGPRARRSCGFGPGFEGDLIAEAFEAALEIGNSATLADLVEIGVSEIAITAR